MPVSEKTLLRLAVVVLAVINIALWVTSQTPAPNADLRIPESRLTLEDSAFVGLYTYPGVGLYFLKALFDTVTEAPPLTMVVFLSAQTSCPACLSEVEILRRIRPVYESRGHLMMAVTEETDSAAVSEWMLANGLSIPLVTLDFLDLTLWDIGISSYFMPYKVLYDSTLTAIYMRGADNTPQSQKDFEVAALRISAAIANDWNFGVRASEP